MHIDHTGPPNISVKLSTALLYLSTTSLLAALVVASFNPGCMNVDTMDMWGQAHSRVYHDWHSVALTIIMTYLIKLHNDFQPVLVLQILLFSSGLLMTIRKYSGPLLGVSLLLLCGLAPPIFAWLGVVGVDSFMACCLVFAIGAIYRYKDGGRRLFFWLGLLGLYLGLATRHNGIFAVVPLLAWTLLRRPWLRSSLKIVLVLVGFAVLLQLTNVVYRVQHEYPEQAGFLYDLGALSIRSGTMLVPVEFQKPGITLPAIQKEMDPSNDGWLFWGPDSVFEITWKASSMRQLERTWVKAVITHPKQYLAWRSLFFANYLGVVHTELEPVMDSCIAPNDLGLVPVNSRLHVWTMNHLLLIEQSIFFRPYFYLSILLIFLAQGFWLKRWDTVAIAAAGIAYSLAYFIFGQSTNFRLACFTNFAAVLLIVRLIVERVSAVRANSKVQTKARPALYFVVSALMLIALAGIVRASPGPTAVSVLNGFSNADFEKGHLEPWKPYQGVHASITSENHHGGFYSLAESDGSGSVYQDITGLQPGKTYRITAWVSASPGATAPAQIAVWDPTANVARFSDAVMPNPTWQPIEMAMSNTAGTLRIHLFRQQGTGTVYWDDVQVYKED